MNSSWEKIWPVLLSVAIILLAWWAFFAPRHVVGYYIGGVTINTEVFIKADIENSLDVGTALGQGTTMWDAIRMVDSLNRQCERKPQ